MPNKLTRIKLHKNRQAVDLTFDDGLATTLSSEYLRVFSPSAEVRGHGGEGAMLVIGKEAVRIVTIEPVGRYAVKLVFDDGHDSGLYDWDTLHDLSRNHDQYWSEYLGRLAAVGIERNPEAQAPEIRDVLAGDAQSHHKSKS